MNPLQYELDRLYGLGRGASAAQAAATADAGADTEASGAARVSVGSRVAVLSAVHPVGWEALSSVWRGVQSDLDLPAPAIAVSGVDALQLWFAFATAVSPAAAARLLNGLRKRYLQGVAPSQVRVLADAAHIPVAPCVEVGTQRWSAFVTPDLASVFAETPWLDIAPGDEGQASILRGLAPIGPAALEAALNALGESEGAVAETGAAGPAAPAAAPAADVQACDPVRFLTDVMHDATAPLALRVEAARILLPYAKPRGNGLAGQTGSDDFQR